MCMCVCVFERVTRFLLCEYLRKFHTVMTAACSRFFSLNPFEGPATPKIQSCALLSQKMDEISYFCELEPRQGKEP